MDKHAEITWKQSYVIYRDGAPRAIMAVGRSESYTREEWNGLTRQDREAVKLRYDAFYRIAR